MKENGLRSRAAYSVENKPSGLLPMRGMILAFMSIVAPVR
jgi:hypothetical protein